MTIDSETTDRDGSEDETPPGVRRRSTLAWLGTLLVLVLLSEEVAYAFNLVTPALPNMAADYAGSNIGWVATVFTLSGAICSPIIGKLADRHGKKTWLLLCAACMSLGSLTVALSSSFAVVLVGRTVEGIGLSIIPLSYSLIRDIFPRRMLALAVSITTAGVGVTSITGPYIAGYLIDHHGYNAVFWLLAIYPAVIGALVLIAVPESPIRIRTSIDWIGGMVLGIAVGVALYAIGEGATWGWGSGKTLGTLALAVVLLLLWGAYERRIAEPLIDLVVLRSKAVLTTLVAQFAQQAVSVIQFVILAFVVQTPVMLGITYGLGGDASYMARITTPGGILSVAAGFAVGYLAERRGARLSARVSFGLMFIGSVSIAFAHSSFAQVLAGYAIVAFGAGMATAAIPNLVIAATPVRLQAVTASTVNVVGSVGSAVAVQLAFAILASNVQNSVQGQPIYSGTGITAVYLLGAGFCLAGFVACLVMSHGRRPQSAEVEHDADATDVQHA